MAHAHPRPSDQFLDAAIAVAESGAALAQLLAEMVRDKQKAGGHEPEPVTAGLPPVSRCGLYRRFASR